jgi:hypothetical protein
MEKVAAYVEGDPLDPDKERLREAEKSERLEKRRQELARDPDVGSRPQLRAIPKPPPMRSRDAFWRGVVQVPEDTVTELLSVLARGQSKLPTPTWPKFNDSYRIYWLLLFNFQCKTNKNILPLSPAINASSIHRGSLLHETRKSKNFTQKRNFKSK